MQDWKPPSFIEITMNAEVGAYQNELDEACGSPLQQPPADDASKED